MNSSCSGIFDRTARGERGSQLVEFALIIPLFLMLVFGTIDFGRGFFSWIIITNAAREGARAAAMGWDDAVVYERVEAAVSGLSTSGTLTTGDSASGACPPVSSQDWCITADIDGLRGDPATVHVEYNFQFLVPGLAGLTPDIFQLTAESTMRKE